MALKKWLTGIAKYDQFCEAVKRAEEQTPVTRVNKIGKVF